MCLGNAAPSSACDHEAMPARLQTLPQGAGVVLPMPEPNKSDVAQRPLRATATTSSTATPHSPAPLEVTLRGGAVVRSADLKQLAELLQLLG
ncbi:MAG: hypothetical protein WC360_09070, partial [Opitutales bacterium]